MLRKHLFLLVIVLVLGGCMFPVPVPSLDTQYPDEWPELINTKNIETDIESSYVCFGEGKKEGRDINGRFNLWRGYAICQILEVKKTETGLLFNYILNGKSIVTQEYLLGQDYKVAGSWIKFKAQKIPTVDNNPNRNVEVSLTLNETGELVVKQIFETSELDGGLVAVIPVVVMKVDWDYRWGRYVQATEESLE